MISKYKKNKILHCELEFTKLRHREFGGYRYTVYASCEYVQRGKNNHQRGFLEMIKRFIYI